jgi:hypothetical protein
MSQNSNDDYSKYFEVLDASIDKLVSTKKQYIDKPNRVNSVLFRKQLLELKTVLGQSRQDVLRVNKAKTKKPEEVKEDVTDIKAEPEKVSVEVVKVEPPEPVELAPVVAQVEPTEPAIVEVTPEVTPAIVVVDTEKNKRKARIQPNKKLRQ